MALTYRREIDGLRAIAVSAVVLYHAGLASAAGYIGVDIFFVISGYLITALLLRENLFTGRIDLADFYARRVRRIFPAAALVLLAVLAAVPLLPSPARAGVLASAASAAVFGANVFFQYATAGYFNGDAAQFPLLHLWSLSVEEQYYLVWPALLILLLRMGVPVRAALAVLAVASFALAEWLQQGHPSAAFYSMPARAWELAAGALVATSAPRALPRWVGWVALALTTAACLAPIAHFPGAGALPAVAGAALLLAAIHGGATNALLASRPMVGVGLISYSLYLWHWPLLTIDRLLRVGPAPLAVRLGLVAAAVLLAIASYRYVETPLRRPWGSSRRTVAIGFAGMAVVFCGALAWRAPAPAAVPPVVAVRCVPFVAGDTRVQRPSCYGKEPKIVLWGDSYAHAWTPLAQALGARMQQPITTFALDGCPPIIGVRSGLRSEDEAAACRAWNAKALAYLRANGADTVVVTARWQNFLPAGGPRLMSTIHDIAPHVRRILVFGPTPVLPDEPAKCAVLGSDCSVERSAFEAGAAPARQILAALAAEPKVTVADPAAWLCEAVACPGFRDGQALYTDTIHVSAAAASAFGAKFAAAWN
jgi:peptidoglycan/LPS O-acetylase OafA/YrhL